jgi:hypothetical protein
MFYKVEEWDGSALEGSFYADELQLVEKDMTKDMWKVEKLLKKRKGPRGRVEWFVKWEGFPDSMNSWVPAADLKDLPRS